jgi:hypothetical protein
MALSLAQAVAGKQDLKPVDISEIVEKHKDRLVASQKAKQKKTGEGLKLSNLKDLKLENIGTTTQYTSLAAEENSQFIGGQGGIRDQAVQSALTNPGSEVEIFNTAYNYVAAAEDLNSSIQNEDEQFNTLWDPQNGVVSKSGGLLGPREHWYKAYNDGDAGGILNLELNRVLGGLTAKEKKALESNPKYYKPGVAGKQGAWDVQNLIQDGHMTSYIGSTPISKVPLFGVAKQTVGITPQHGKISATNVITTSGQKELYDFTFTHDDINVIAKYEGDLNANITPGNFLEMGRVASLNIPFAQAQLTAQYNQISSQGLQGDVTLSEFVEAGKSELLLQKMNAENKLISFTGRASFTDKYAHLNRKGGYNFWGNNLTIYGKSMSDLGQDVSAVIKNDDFDASEGNVADFNLTFEELADQLAEHQDKIGSSLIEGTANNESDNVVNRAKLKNTNLVKRGDNNAWLAVPIPGAVEASTKAYRTGRSRSIYDLYFPKFEGNEVTVDGDNVIISTYDSHRSTVGDIMKLQDQKGIVGDYWAKSGENKTDLDTFVEEAYVGYAQLNPTTNRWEILDKNNYTE